jgi:hypothetical protein
MEVWTTKVPATIRRLDEVQRQFEEFKAESEERSKSLDARVY